MYLVLRTEVFRSEDAGKQWEFIGHVLRSDNVREAGDFNFRIWDALTVDDVLFVGTSRGLFRLTNNWKKMPVPISHGIFPWRLPRIGSTSGLPPIGWILIIQPKSSIRPTLTIHGLILRRIPTNIQLR